jgi:hypothetical protein
MKKYVFLILPLILLLSCESGEDVTNEQLLKFQQGIRLEDSEKYIIDFFLRPSGSQKIIIEDYVNKYVGFKTNGSHEDFKKYQERTYIKAQIMGSDFWFSSVYGTAIRITTSFLVDTLKLPIDTESIILNISNFSDHEVRVLVYTKE